jgi:hypothetical protein
MVRINADGFGPGVCEAGNAGDVDPLAEFWRAGNPP